MDNEVTEKHKAVTELHGAIAPGSCIPFLYKRFLSFVRSSVPAVKMLFQL